MKETSGSTLKDKVYKQIIELICSGQFATGSFITEPQMIELSGASKSPVREALLQLCYEGTLKNIPRCGYQIVPISVKDIHDLTEMRLILELHNITKICSDISQDHLDELKRMAKSRQQKDKDVWVARNNNLRFHLYLAEINNNKYLCETLQRIFAVCTRAYAQLYTSSPQILSPEKGHHHDGLIQALEEHDSKKACECLEQDILLMETQLLQR